MTSLTLIDTSAWIEFLRPNGDQVIADLVEEALVCDQAATCDIVMLELWNGAGNLQQRKKLRQLEQNIHALQHTSLVWRTARNLAEKARDKGLSIPSTDLLIFSTAKLHSASLICKDKHFDWLKDIDPM